MDGGISMKLWHNVILINSKRSWELSGCGYINKGCHALLKIGVLGLKSWIGPYWHVGTVRCNIEDIIYGTALLKYR